MRIAALIVALVALACDDANVASDASTADASPIASDARTPSDAAPTDAFVCPMPECGQQLPACEIPCPGPCCMAPDAGPELPFDVCRPEQNPCICDKGCAEPCWCDPTCVDCGCPWPECFLPDGGV